MQAHVKIFKSQVHFLVKLVFCQQASLTCLIQLRLILIYLL